MPTLNPFAPAWVPPASAISQPAMSRSIPIPVARVQPPTDTQVRQLTPVGHKELREDEEEDKEEDEEEEVVVEDEEDDDVGLFPALDEEDPATFGDSDSLTGESDGLHSPSNPAGSSAAFDTVLNCNEAALAGLQLEMEMDGPVLGSAAKVGLQDFELLRLVGQGAFGKVFQVRHKRTNEIFAMKVMRKERILQKDHSEYVKSERDLLTAVTHPYIVALRFSFQTPSKLYLILDFLNGGHLFFNLYREGVFGEDVAKLYTAEIVSALSYLHGQGIMHRDLKPENVLLDNQGHIRLTDFGLAKGNVMDEEDRCNSFIGTMEYMAPEIIEGKGHTKSVDWWSTGILLYEMLCGIPPFRAKSRQALQQQILTGKIKYPKFLSTDSHNLLKALLVRDPSKRIGSGPTGCEAIKKHPFFKTINWSKLERREIESKFRPTVKCSASVENFDKIWTDQPAEDSPCGSPIAQQVSHFQGFTYVSPSFLLSTVAAVKASTTA